MTPPKPLFRGLAYHLLESRDTVVLLRTLRGNQTTEDFNEIDSYPASQLFRMVAGSCHPWYQPRRGHFPRVQRLLVLPRQRRRPGNELAESEPGFLLRLAAGHH